MSDPLLDLIGGGTAAPAAPGASAPSQDPLLALVGSSAPTQAPAPQADQSRSLWDQVGDFGNAAVHNVLKPIHGLTQTVEHGLGTVADWVDPNYKSGLSSLITGAPNRSGWNQSLHGDITNDDAAMKNWEQTYQNNTPDNAASYAGATVGTIAPFLTSATTKGLQFVGDQAASLVPKVLGNAAPLIPRIVSGAAQGTTLALASPVTDDGDFWSNKANQAKWSGLVGGGIPIVGAAARGLYNVAKPLINPNGVVADALKNWIPGGPSAVVNADELVPGSLPTTAQAAPSPQIVAVEKTLSENPAYKGLFAERSNANNAARIAAIQDVAGTPEQMAAALDKRATDAAPMLSQMAGSGTPVWRQNIGNAVDTLQSTIDASPRMSGADFDALQQAATWARSAQRGNIDSQTLYNNLAGLNVTSKAAQQAIVGAGNSLKNMGNLVDAAPVLSQLSDLQGSSLGTDPVVKKGVTDLIAGIKDGIANTQEGGTLVRPDLLDGYRQNVRNILKQYATNGAVGSRQEAAFEPVRSAIVDAIDGANPGYRDYLANYAKNSAPINSMEAAGSILDNVAGGGRSANSSGTEQITLPGYRAALAKALNDSPYGLDPAAQAKLEAVQADLQRASISNSVKSPGSDTSYNLQAPGWLAKQLYGGNFQGPGSLVKGAAAAAGGALGGGFSGAAGGYLGASKLAEVASKRVNDALAEALLNPAKAQQLLQPSSISPVWQQLLQRAPQAGLLMGNKLTTSQQLANQLTARP